MRIDFHLGPSICLANILILLVSHELQERMLGRARGTASTDFWKKLTNKRLEEKVIFAVVKCYKQSPFTHMIFII